MLEFKGKVEKIFDAQHVSDKFKKQELVLVGGNDGKQYVTFQAVQNKCELLNQISEGETVTVQFLPKGRKWTPDNGPTRYFNTLEIIHILGNGKKTEEDYDFFSEDKKRTDGDDWLEGV